MKKHVSILISVIMICFRSTIYSMDHVPVIKDQMIAWKIVLEHGVRYFDYRIISSLAVSKDHEALLLSTADCRKKYLTQELDLSKNVTWHKYGAMCGLVEHDICSVCWPNQDLSDEIKRETGIRRMRFYLTGDDNQYRPYSVTDSRFYSCLPYQPRPFFNERTEFCFYGYQRKNSNDENNGKIITYIWYSTKNSRNANHIIEQCMTNIKNKKDERIDLTVFLEFPVLLKAFLKSRLVYKKEREWGIDQKIYAIEGVTIPENYEYHKPYFSSDVYKSFKDLPKNIRKAIIARYKAQGKKN